MQTAIIYISVHHGNTYKVAAAMAAELQADLINIAEAPPDDLSQYELLGFASGVFYGKLHEKLLQYLNELELTDKQKVFFAATCGMAYRDYTKSAKTLLTQKGVHCLGSFQCRGFDTFGPFAKIGGIAKQHPNEKDLKAAQTFARQILSKAQ